MMLQQDTAGRGPQNSTGKAGKYAVVAICAIKTRRQASVMVLAGILQNPLCFTHIALLILPLRG
ncbi:hypothetical protein D3C86_2223800 [compost metagenome]